MSLVSAPAWRINATRSALARPSVSRTRGVTGAVSQCRRFATVATWAAKPPTWAAVFLRSALRVRGDVAWKSPQRRGLPGVCRVRLGGVRARPHPCHHRPQGDRCLRGHLDYVRHRSGNGIASLCCVGSGGHSPRECQLRWDTGDRSYHCSACMAWLPSARAASSASSAPSGTRYPPWRAHLVWAVAAAYPWSCSAASTALPSGATRPSARNARARSSMSIAASTRASRRCRWASVTAWGSSMWPGCARAARRHRVLRLGVSCGTCAASALMDSWPLRRANLLAMAIHAATYPAGPCSSVGKIHAPACLCG